MSLNKEEAMTHNVKAQDALAQEFVQFSLDCGVLRFGEFVKTTMPGLHYHLPYPIETVLLPKVTKVNQLNLGFRTSGESRFDRANSGRDVPEESRMLTGDENIIEVQYTVFWQIKDASNYLFKIASPEVTVSVTPADEIDERVLDGPPVTVPRLAPGPVADPPDPVLPMIAVVAPTNIA